MDYKNKKISMEDVNKDIYLAMANSLKFPLNEIVAWAIFGDNTFVNENALLYSNYADTTLDNALINESHLELMNTIEQDIKQCIDENTDNVDFSTMHSTNEGINNILDIFLPAKCQELNLLLRQKDSIFRGLPIWWAALVIAYRELAIFAYKNGSYYLAMQFSESCNECQSQMMFKNIAFIKAYQEKLSNINKTNSITGWKGIVEKQRRRYLEIDRQYSKKLGRKTYIKDAAEFIYFNHNDFNMGFETIRDHLSAARNGVFTNNGK